MILFYIFLSILLFRSVYSSLTVEYYENLISQRTKEAEEYKERKRNEEFKSGYESRDIKDYGSYDFIIVGAGSAGSVLATRLSEIDDFTILLLEAGGEEDDFSRIMGMNHYLAFSDMSWPFYTITQNKSCLGMKEQQCRMHQGKSIGGGSAINAMMYVRGNKKDYDRWAELGNNGWSYEEVLPYFKKSENSEIAGDVGYHGKGGLWNVVHSLSPPSVVSNFINASMEVKQPILDYNGRNQLGSALVQSNLSRGRRLSTGTTFLDHARQRKNLQVLTKTLATKIIIDPGTKTAKGIEFVKGDQLFKAVATKEIIVSTGAINTPRLLMLSGIGPRQHLKQLGIKVIADLPVGQNYREHPMFPALVFRTNQSTPSYSTKEFVEMYLNGVGPFTRGAGVDGIGFIHTGKRDNQVPTVEYLFAPPSGLSNPILRKMYNYNAHISNEFMDKINPETDITVLLALLHPKSKGTISLKSASPIDFPNIDLNMLDEKEDVDNFIEGIHFVLDLFKTEPFKNINAELLDYPICQEFKKRYKRDNEFWECIIRHMAITIFHSCCTTPMGLNPETSVVNSNLKVYGIQHLRVVDAGVMPTTISGHTNAATIMIAEKISDVIKQTYR